MRRRERVPELVEQAEPWDIVVIDEARHARRKSPVSPWSRTAQWLARIVAPDQGQDAVSPAIDGHSHAGPSGRSLGFALSARIAVRVARSRIPEIP